QRRVARLQGVGFERRGLVVPRLALIDPFALRERNTRSDVRRRQRHAVGVVQNGERLVGHAVFFAFTAGAFFAAARSLRTFAGSTFVRRAYSSSVSGLPLP